MSLSERAQVVIVGAGPAGLSAASRLVDAARALSPHAPGAV
jgi:flavin-dependent dehydrogenase